MKHPSQAIFISTRDSERQEILEGKKNLTIREGFRNYVNGHCILCCHRNPWAVLCDITSVKHVCLIELTLEECRAEGFEDCNAAMEGLGKFYPNLVMDSPMTVIRWNNLQGKIVDEFKMNKFKEVRGL